MIAIDTNILVYAHRRESEFWPPAERCVREIAESGRPWAIPWPCIHEFYSTVTHPRIFSPAGTADEALCQIEAWMQSPTLQVLSETPLHWNTLRTMIVNTRILGPVVHDARIAALCFQHGVSELWSADRHFSQFPNIKAINPLVKKTRL